MTTDIEDPELDAELRESLRSVNPWPGPPPAVSDGLRVRVAHDVTAGRGARPLPEVAERSMWRRHWLGITWAAAAAASLLIVAAVVAVPFAAEGEAAVEALTSGGAVSSAPRSGDAAVTPANPGDGTSAAGPQSGGSAGASTTQQLARSAEVLVGTDDISTQRDRFVAEIQAMGGVVTSEWQVTDGDSGGVQPMIADGRPQGTSAVVPDTGVMYPWQPSGPGVWLSVEVPVAEYDNAVAAARSTGTVVRMEQTTSDITVQTADVEARANAMAAALSRLTALLGQASSVTEVVALEDAIATRQAELDSLRAQQRELASLAKMSRVSLTLMSPDDAKAAVTPGTSYRGWERMWRALSNYWMWLGGALLVLSPFVVAAVVTVVVRRRLRRRADGEE